MSEPNQLKNTKKSKPSNKWRKILVFFVFLSLVAYFISLFILNSTWFKNKISSKLQAKLPIQNEWEIGSISWFPFGKVNAHDLKTKMGAGGISLVSLEVTPSWSALFTGNILLEEVTIQGAHLDLDLRWLKENQQKLTHQKAQQQPPVKPVNKPTDSEKSAITKTTGSQKKADEKQTAASQPKPKEKEASKVEVIPEPIIETPNKWVKLDDLKFTLRNGETIIDHVNDIKLYIPIAGKPNDGEISYRFHSQQYTQKIHWDGKQLSAKNPSGKQFGLNYQWDLRCDIKKPGAPFNLNFTVPKQALTTKINQPNYHWSLNAASAQAVIRISGGLKSPNTWRGLIQAKANQLTVSEDQKTHKRVEFDTVKFIGNLSGGTLHIPVAEAIGYDLSIMSNGVIQNNLYSYGVLRIIGHDRSKAFFNRVYRATKLIDVGPRHAEFFRQLDTLDRAYCDLYFDGKLNELEVLHNRSEKWKEVMPVIKKLINFKDAELAEDGILEPPEEGG